MTRRVLDIGGYTPLYPLDLGLRIEASDMVPSLAKKAIIVCHGRGGSAMQAGRAPMEPYLTALVQAGYCVYGIDHARINSWGDPDAVRATYAAYLKLQALGFYSKIGFMGWSMGGTTALTFLARYASLVSCAWLWNPVTDSRFYHDTAGQYPTMPYSAGTAAASQAIWTAELDSTFAPSTAAVGAYTIPVSTDPTGITITITTNTGISFADGNTFGGLVALPRAIVNGVQFTYTGKTDSTLTGCKSTTGATIAVANAAAITTTGLFTTQSPAYVPFNYPSVFAGLGPKVVISQASDDATVPPGMNANDANGFVGRVGHTDVTLRSPSPTGGHSFSIVNAQVPISEVLAFYQANM